MSLTLVRKSTIDISELEEKFRESGVPIATTTHRGIHKLADDSNETFDGTSSTTVLTPNIDSRFYDINPSRKKSYVPFGSGITPRDLNVASGDSDRKGFTGGFTDGRYLYLVPENNGGYFGKFTRVDLNDFFTTTSIDLSTLNVNYVGFSGGFTDGRYAYLIPGINGVGPHGNFIRIDLSNFSLDGVTVLNVASLNTNFRGFSGGFTDGRYGYLVPKNNGSYHGNLVRVDLLNFSLGFVSNIDLAQINPGYVGFSGGFTDGKYGYLVPYYNGVYHGTIVRIELSYFSSLGVSVMNLATINSSFVGFKSGFTDGRYGYLVPGTTGTYHGNFVRFDLYTFSINDVEYIDLTSVDSNLKGFSGGVSDGRYAYLVPQNNDSPHGYFPRIELNDFSSNGVNFVNLEDKDPLFKGYHGGVFDGKNIYLIPYNNGSPHGNLLKFQAFFGGGL